MIETTLIILFVLLLPFYIGYGRARLKNVSGVGDIVVIILFVLVIVLFVSGGGGK